jgi:predicted aminopeptidase
MKRFWIQSQLRNLVWIAVPVLGLGWFLLGQTGCASLGYYGQAASGQLELLGRQRPVEEILTDPEAPPRLRKRLETARAMRVFASTELALPDNDSYRNYADLGRPYVVWNVFAAPELSLEPKEWCFLVVGCVAYRGYFNEADARALGEQLRAEGYDVYVAGIPAYSTLGWFDDPLLNTFLHWSEGRLAELVFHELAHQRLFIDGDTTFNESFATTVGWLGARRWLERYGTARDREAYELFQQRRQAFLALVLSGKRELRELYQSGRGEADTRAGKQRVLGRLRARYENLKQVSWDGYNGYDRWFEQDLNNAKLAGLSAYTRYVPAFEALFERQEEDFAAFYEAVTALGALPAETREARLRDLMNEGARQLAARQPPDLAVTKGFIVPAAEMPRHDAVDRGR